MLPKDVLRQLFVFSCIGAAGFVVDAVVLAVLLKITGWGLYISRVGSFLAAATFTWAANRIFTFPTADRSQRAAQWMKFVALNGIGGAVNLGVYAYLVTQFHTVARWPTIGVAAGSLAGLLFNFTLSRSLVFRTRSTA